MINPLIALRRRDHLIGFGLALLHLTFLLSTAAQVGVPRDESFYFYAADRAADWVDGLFDSKVASFSRTEIDRGFEYNHEHPVLMKMLFGVSHRVLHDKLGVIDSNMTAYRLPTMVMAALASWLAFLLGLMLHGRLAGVLGVLAGILIPRVFFHSHLACFDGPVTFMTLLICYTYLRAARSRGWAIACGVAFGLGLATKLNTFFVPFTLLAVAALDTWTFRRRTGAWRAPAGQRGPLTYYSWIAVSLIVLGLVVFLAHWPWLYYDTLPRLRSYFAFHARHVDYPVDYFGFLYFKPPFPVHYPFVMSAITIPLGILLAGLIGFGVFARSARACFKAPADAPDRRSAEAMV
ncbi:MAG: glycosyltransferase family 39 protein, partial [Myxococcales bacterium]|nr:glycosyltransferase family 39 protein [Myxococcales bacterium]